MGYFLLFLTSFILGILACPIVIFLRARKCDQWGHSNVMNILRVFAPLVKSRPKER